MIQRLNEKLPFEKWRLTQYQKGLIQPIKTERPYLEEPFGGLIPGDILVISGHTSAGKTFELMRLKRNIMDTLVNPSADNFVWLDYSFEMKLFSTLLRELAYVTDLPKSHILFNEFTPSEIEIVKNAMSKWEDVRFFIDDTPLSVEVFARQTDEFLANHSDKNCIFIAIDHLSLFRGNNKTSLIGDVLSYCNEFKLKYPNVIFIYLSQMSPEFFKRLDEKNRRSQPTLTDLFYSSEIAQYADYVMVITNPHKLGINEYSYVNPDHYPHLVHYMTELDKKGKASFDTRGLIFYHLLKAREADIGFTDIFVDELKNRDAIIAADQKQEQSTKQILSEKAKQQLDLIFKPSQTDNPPIKPNKDLVGFDDFPFS